MQSMETVLDDIPPGVTWCWSSEFQRMHIQTVDQEHKVWLESNGTRAFERVNKLPADVERILRQVVAVERTILDAKWIAFMIKNGWLFIDSYVGGVITLVVYPKSPASRHVEIDLNEVLPRIVREISRNDFGLCTNPAAVVVWTSRNEASQHHLDLTEYIWNSQSIARL
jgi:hypothetical protein